MALKINKAAIIAVGDEVLCGEVVNTNTAYIAGRLEKIGIKCVYQCVISDDTKQVKEQISHCEKIAELIITIGGLGPTKDDLTKEAVADYLNLNLEEDKASLEAIYAYFNIKGVKPTPNNTKQALIPKGAYPIKNTVGTAPGVYLEKDEKIYIMLPGPPGELMPMFDCVLENALKSRAEYCYAQKSYILWGMGESKIEQLIRDNIKTTPNFTLNTYAGVRYVRLKATCYAKNHSEALSELEQKEKQVKALLNEELLYEGNASLNEVAGELLKQKKLTISTAESCTGGLLASRLTEIGGISSVFPGSAVTYCDEVKMKVLGVRQKTLTDFTAVSSQTAQEMADGVREYFSSDIGISTTGYAGPSGGDDGTPVGQVYIGINFKGKKEVIGNIYKGERNRVREQAAEDALALLIKHLKNS